MSCKTPGYPVFRGKFIRAERRNEKFRSDEWTIAGGRLAQDEDGVVELREHRASDFAGPRTATRSRLRVARSNREREGLRAAE